MNLADYIAFIVSDSYHVIVGFGSPTHLHSKTTLPPSSLCRIMGLSVNVGLIPSSGIGASSPRM